MAPPKVGKMDKLLDINPICKCERKTVADLIEEVKNAVIVVST